MRLLVAGGRLQGVEAAYLAKQAGFWVRVVDRLAPVPAMDLGDEFLQADLTTSQGMAQATRGIDLILPAMENAEALSALTAGASRLGIPLAFDPAAYAVSSSKQISDSLFARHRIPAPTPWPACGFPVVVKPSQGSGSEGVVLLTDDVARVTCFGDAFPPVGQVVQQYLAGPSFSIEVIGYPGSYRILPATALEMDADHDCKRVLAPTGLAADEEAQLADIGRILAETLNLVGIMDVEVIRHDGEFKVLEIDARLPSQTPIAVFHSSGINEVKLLAELFLGGGSRRIGSLMPPRGVILEHIQSSGGRLKICGEHIMSVDQALRQVNDFFGADEALTTFSPGSQDWVATLIITADDRQAAWAKHEKVMDRLKDAFGVETVEDAFPDVPRKAENIV